MNNPALIQEQIESARNELYRMENKHGGLLHPNVIKQSMRLDELINMYNQAVLGINKKQHLNSNLK